MNKIWSTLTAILSALVALFYVSNKRKDREIEKHKDEVDKLKTEVETQSYIATAEKEARKDRDHINTLDESDVDGLLEQHKAYRD